MARPRSLGLDPDAPRHDALGAEPVAEDLNMLDAVHERHDEPVGNRRRIDLIDGGGQVRRLHGDEQCIDHRPEVLDGRDRGREVAEKTARHLNLGRKPGGRPGPQDEHDVVSASDQGRADEPPDGARAEHGDSHRTGPDLPAVGPTSSSRPKRKARSASLGARSAARA